LSGFNLVKFEFDCGFVWVVGCLSGINNWDLIIALVFKTILMN